ncbi:glycogen phosphorylase [Holotrichia oblita]|nr:glycogen phosphorylase [Holotrichia oblita]
MAIIADGQIRMAYLAIVGSHSVNGVAALHTEILKNQELKSFYEIYPEKFNNKTNGITQRRWLAYANPELSTLITENIGDKWVTDLSELRKLERYADDKAFQEKFMAVKRNNKVNLAHFIKAKTGLAVDPDSIFDIQVKRLHEYKRQLLNILHVLDLYNRIKETPWIEVEPRTFIFGPKAAASYKRAKLIIKLINNVANLVNNDPAIEGRIKVVFLENYRVSLAEKLIPACDVSEQISTAGKEASGTGNMKFMLNGALTLGTLDGANVEILEEVGPENIFIFGLTAEEVSELFISNSYDPWDVYNMNQSVRKTLTQLISGALSDDHELFRELFEALLNGYGGSRPDEYFILKDFEAYSNAQDKVSEAYKNKAGWARSAILNVAYSEFALINIGILLVALGIHLFKNPNKFALGGISGLSIVLRYFVPDAPIGKDAAFRSVYGSYALSGVVWLLEIIAPISGPLTAQPLLELFYSILLPGVGSAVVFNYGATTGGTDIIAKILSKFFKIKVSYPLLALDFSIALAAGLLFGVQTCLFSLFGVMLRILVLDSLMENFQVNKIVVVISEKSGLIKSFICDELNRGATIHKATGAFTVAEKEVITTVLGRGQARNLQLFIKRADPEAFVTISNSSQIIGKGFNRFD